MAWPYRFLTLSPEEVQLRRQALDRYAIYAQISALLPIFISLTQRIVERYTRGREVTRGAYDVVPDSPLYKCRKGTVVGRWLAKVRIVQWWSRDEVIINGQSWGTRDQWMVGMASMIWMLVLCIAGTGEDYLHFTKRLGTIATALMPFQYLLILKSFSPLAWVFNTSHETLNRWHRVLARVITALLILHAACYLNYFAQVGILQRRLFAPVVFAGVVAFAGLNLLNTTALRAVRAWSYRVFFITHLVVAMAIPPLIFIHAPSARLSVGTALVLFLADIAMRRLRTTTSQATLETIPGTTLVKIMASIPGPKVNAFRAKPGAHIYLSIPAAARPIASNDALLYEFLFNPFTVADVDDHTGALTLVARQHDGPLTRRLAQFAQHGGMAMPSSTTTTVFPAAAATVPLSIEGPYGTASRHFAQIASPRTDRVLLIAGGVGATFAVPLYRAVLADHPAAKVELVWAIRAAGDATWAVTGRGDSVLEDENVNIFLTGDLGVGTAVGVSEPRRASFASSSDAGGGASGDAGEELSSLYRDRRRAGGGGGGGRWTSSHSRRRPDLRRIIDDTFRGGPDERVAVLVCGPASMAREVRRHVGAWVYRGRDVFFHDESFGW
ncbi:uncharacterized protein VDAG_00820 [Verticillium dahliae VdLs.17]|uniref:FAD-binding FR-type domain-containing protein n=2 Tax=Verticillium dahliae TaxID=27337 RepID=G2WSN9_VERDV|nr:uncharacterized protein VDAG_00820 [Verticillium dahliae VdLs.17]EGY17138.1 hypothetical protein VDAG_00820 [Verticillium dahliae VdLs.17]PNH32602.1 hypothetical protein BJF96_g4151 [Verticillium dahliae]PNH50489.1 hypothetical protein VD0003_g6693 [Verticillium dahliae]